MCIRDRLCAFRGAVPGAAANALRRPERRRRLARDHLGAGAPVDGGAALADAERAHPRPRDPKRRAARRQGPRDDHDSQGERAGGARLRLGHHRRAAAVGKLVGARDDPDARRLVRGAGWL
eukprot:826027-Prymnesium_polylepis.1